MSEDFDEQTSNAGGGGNEIACFSLHLFLSDTLTNGEIASAVEELQSAAVAMPFESISIRREGKKLHIDAEFKDKSKSDELSDTLLEVLRTCPESRSFPG